jgi:hypothetical protein
MERLKVDEKEMKAEMEDSGTKMNQEELKLWKM